MISSSYCAAVEKRQEQAAAFESNRMVLGKMSFWNAICDSVHLPSGEISLE